MEKGRHDLEKERTSNNPKLNLNNNSVSWNRFFFIFKNQTELNR